MGFWQQLSLHVTQNAPAYVLATLAVGLTALGLALAHTIKLRAALRPLSRFAAGGDDPSGALSSILHAVEENKSGIDELARRLDSHVGESRSFLRHAGLTRYDAFEDIGGMQSFSLCLLDGEKNGLIITYLTGKNSTRSYAVNIEGGRASRKLSDEETQAMDTAMGRETLAQA